jgi:hypothetical protein
MLATVHVLHPQPSVIGGFLRIGHTGHRTLEALHAAGTLKFNRSCLTPPTLMSSSRCLGH